MYRVTFKSSDFYLKIIKWNVQSYIYFILFLVEDISYMVGLMLLHGSIPINKSNGEILYSNLWLVWIPLRRSGKKI